MLLDASGCLERGWTKSEGAALVGHFRFVDSPWPSFLFFFLGFVFAAAPAFVVLRLYVWLYDGCCFIYKAGRKPISRGIARVAALGHGA